MSRKYLVSSFNEMAALLELDGANVFKINAYAKAARALSDLTENLDTLRRENRLTEVEGIGKGIAEKIEEYYKTGKIKELDELRRKIPHGLLDLTRIPGFGPKKTKQVYEELGIKSLEELKAAAEDGRLGELKGFAKKTVEKILAGIEQIASYSGRHRLDDATDSAQPIIEALEKLKGVEECSIAGSLRRSKELIGDLDFVVSTKNPEPIMEFFTTQEDVTEVLGKGETKSSVILSGHIQADIRCVSKEQYPFALLHFTGSKEHNTRLRGIAKDLGLKLNEYGLFPDGSEKSLSAKSEADVYRHLKLDFIPPEMREDRGEVEAAAEGKLPKLIEEKDLRGLMHMHTTWSDGRPELEQYAEWAVERGFEWMGIADHSKTSMVANGLNEERVLQQQSEIDEINARYTKKGVRLLKGIECDILPDGRLDYTDDFLKNFEWLVISVHSHFNLTEEEQTKRIRRAMDNPHATILGHMTGRLLLTREPYPVDQQELIRAAAKNGIAIEINANPYRLDMDWRLIRFALDEGVKLSIGPDAHAMKGLDDYKFGLSMVRKGWATKESILNCLSVKEFLSFAKSRK